MDKIAEYAFVYQDVTGWWVNLTGRRLGPFKTRARAVAEQIAYQ